MVSVYLEFPKIGKGDRRFDGVRAAVIIGQTRREGERAGELHAARFPPSARFAPADEIVSFGPSRAVFIAIRITASRRHTQGRSVVHRHRLRLSANPRSPARRGCAGRLARLAREIRFRFMAIFDYSVCRCPWNDTVAVAIAVLAAISAPA